MRELHHGPSTAHLAARHHLSSCVQTNRSRSSPDLLSHFSEKGSATMQAVLARLERPWLRQILECEVPDYSVRHKQNGMAGLFPSLHS